MENPEIVKVKAWWSDLIKPKKKAESLDVNKLIKGMFGVQVVSSLRPRKIKLLVLQRN